MKNNHKISGEVKEQILRRIKEEGVPVAQAAKEHGASDWWITSVDYEEVRGVAIRGADTQPATFGLMKHPIPVAFTPQLDAIQVPLPACACACAVVRVRWFVCVRSRAKIDV